MKIRVLNQQDMQKVFTMKEAIKAAGDALAMYSAGNTDIPLRANINVAEHGGNSLYMYGYAAPALLKRLDGIRSFCRQVLLATNRSFFVI